MSTTVPDSRRKLVLVAVAVVLVVVAAAVVIRVRHKPDRRTAVSHQTRYCDLAKQFDDLAVRNGAASSPGTFDGQPAAVGRLLTQMGGSIDEMEKDAPGPIGGDVKAVVSAVRQAQTGNTTGVRSSSFASANRRIATFRTTSCQVGSGSGE